MRIDGRALDADGAAAAGVVVYAHHTDAGGTYPTGMTRHGRLRACRIVPRRGARASATLFSVKAVRSIALVQAHQEIQPFHDYYVADLVELAGLAAAIRADVGDVAIPVSPVDRHPLATFDSWVRRHRPELVGISVFTSGARSALEYAAIAKRHGALVVLGGYHPTSRPEECLASPVVDAVVRGQGEHTLLELVRRGDPGQVEGVSWRDGNRIVHNPPRPRIENLDALPLPLREIRPPRFGLRGFDYHTDTIYASRGCRGRCVFCANHTVNGPWRERTMESLFAELETITPPRRGPWKYVKFWDSIFLTDPTRVEALCRMILGAGLERHFRFIVETRVEDVIRARGILKLMRAAGFVRVGVGVESPSATTHRTLRKGISLDNVALAAEMLRDASIQLTTFLIVGHRGESEEEILAYPDWSLRHGVRLQKTTFFVMTPYPGTDLESDYRRDGLVESDNWDLYTNFGAVAGTGSIPARRVQVLHAAVSLRYAMARRFLSGKRAVDVAARTLEPLLLLAKVGSIRGDHDRTAVAAEMFEALRLFGAPVERDRSRHGSRTAVRFHLDATSSVVVGIVARNGRQLLVVERSGVASPVFSRELHVSLPALADLATRLNSRRVTSDLLTLRRAPSGFRTRWLPSFMADIAVIVSWGARALFFQVRCRLRGRSHRGRDAAPTVR